MATQVIETKFISSGANKVAADTQRIGKEQTRLGQASASAGRQFSAQANGLGGLVGAYAGAAANIFAITAAFTALKRAAEFDVIIAGTNALASSIGSSGQKIIASVQDITKSQLSLLETATTVNIGLAAGFNTTQIDQLSEVSLRASKALGRSLTDAFTRVSRGAAKLEPELLDELGIFTRIDPAVQKYADSVGRSASSLTNFERRQAFVNAVIEEGTQKFRDVDVTTNTAAESFERLSATIINLGLQIGSVLATGLAPFADFISGNVSNALAGFGILLSIVGARAVSALSAGILTVTGSIVNLGTKTAEFANRFNKNFITATKSLLEFSSANKLAIRSNSQLAVSINQKLVTVQADIAAGRVRTVAELEAARAVIQSARAEQIAAIRRSSNTASINTQRAALRLLSIENQKLTAAINASSVAGGIATSVFNKLSIAVGILGTVLSRVVGGFLTFITIASLAQIALDGLAKAFGFEGFSILEGIISLLQKVVDFFFKASRELKFFTQTFEQDMRDAANAVGAFGEDADKAISEALGAFDSLRSDFVSASKQPGFNDDLFTLDETLKNLSDPKRGGVAAVQAFLVLLEKIEAFGISPDGLKNLTATFSELAKVSGLAKNELNDFLTNTRVLDGLTVDLDEATSALSISVGDLTASFQKQVGEALRFKAGFRDIAVAAALASDKQNDFDAGIKSGALNAERAAQAVGAIRSVIVDLEAQQIKVNKQIAGLKSGLQDANEEQSKTIKLKIEELIEANKINEALRQQIRNQVTIREATAAAIAETEKQVKLFDKVFGKPGEKLDLAQFRGELDSERGFPTTANEKNLRLVEKLNTLISQGTALQQRYSRELKLIDDLSSDINKKQKELAKVNEIIRNAQERSGENSKVELRNVRKVDSLVSQIQGNQDLINQTQDRINKADSENLDKIRLRDLALQELVLQQQKLVDIAKTALSLEKEVGNLQIKQNTLLLRQSQQLAKNEKLRSDTNFKNDLRRIDTQRKLIEGLELLDPDTQLSFDAAKRSIELKQSQADLNAAKANAERVIKTENDNLEIRKKLLAQEIEIRQKEINTLLALIDALQANRLDIENAQRKATGRAGITTAELPGFVDTGKLKESLETSSKLLKKFGEENLSIQATNTKNEAILKSNAAQANLDILKAQQKDEQLLQQFFAEESVKVFLGVADVVRNNLKTSLEEFFDAVAEGSITLKSFTEGFKDFLRSTFEGIRKTILEETLIKPAQNRATQFLAGAFGFDIDKTPSVVSTGEGNAQLVKIAGESADEKLQQALKEGIGGEKGFFDQIFEKLKTGFSDFGSFIGDTFSSLGTSIRSIFSGITSSFSGGGGSSILGGIFSGVRGIFSGFGGGAPSTIYDFSPGSPFASGGSVQKFANGGMMRDRVPALLEPGEFVIRRQAAKVAGAGNLAALNATGQMGGGNVSVNVTNTGTPQEATASPPRFDGEKMVIDIVMRDLSNNGPIRKTLRAGGAG